MEEKLSDEQPPSGVSASVIKQAQSSTPPTDVEAPKDEEDNCSKQEEQQKAVGHARTHRQDA